MGQIQNGEFDSTQFNDDFFIGTGFIQRVLRISGRAIKLIQVSAKSVKGLLVPSSAIKTKNLTGSILDVENIKRYDRELDP